MKTKENIVYVHKISSKYQLFDSLNDHCKELIYRKPELILKSNNFTIIEKTELIALLERDDLALNEIDVWDYIIKWGIGQNDTLEKNILEWSKGDFKELKKILFH